MINYDGFIISHTTERVETIDNDAITKFIGKHQPKRSLLDMKNPTTFGPLALQDYFFEHKRQVAQAMAETPEVIDRVQREFSELSGRQFDMFESYRLDDAERVVIAINSVAGEIKEVIDELRDAGEKVGLLKIRVFRPFPYEEIAEALSGAKIVTVLDRSTSMGACGPLYTEICTALYNASPKPMLYSRTFGLGGRELPLQNIRELFEENKRYLDNGKIEKMFDWLNVRGD